MELKNTIDGSRILITGGTGSFGYEVVKTLVEKYSVKEIIIFSRDEKKQFDMRNNFHAYSQLSFIIGDVRDQQAVNKVMKNVDLVFHASALKQVPTCEFFPFEAVKTNINGANNVLDAAEENEVKKVVVLSTDKAVYPINAMGMTKALMEKLMLAKARSGSKTIYCGVRYGNVMFSRGSVIPLFINQILNDQPITITSPKMTRYLLPLPIAIDLVLFSLENANNGDILVRKSSASTVENVAIAIKEIFNYKKDIKVIGVREGEKFHETLVTREELIKAEEYDNYYRIKNLESINYDQFFMQGKEKEYPVDGYTSENTNQLNVNETIDLLLSLKEIQEVLRKQ